LARVTILILPAKNLRVIGWHIRGKGFMRLADGIGAVRRVTRRLVDSIVCSIPCNLPVTEVLSHVMRK